MTIGETMQTIMVLFSFTNTVIIVVYFAWGKDERKQKRLFDDFRNDLLNGRIFITREQCSVTSTLTDNKLDELASSVHRSGEKTNDIYKVLDIVRERVSKIEGYMQKNNS